MLRRCKQASCILELSHTYKHARTLLTSVTAHLLVPAGQLDVGLHLHLVNIHSHCRDDTLSKVHAESERMRVDPQMNARDTPQTGVQVHTRDPHRGSEISFFAAAVIQLPLTAGGQMASRE